MTEEKGSKWLFTEWKKPIVQKCKYMIWQKEYCPSTGLEHYQGFVMYDKQYSMKYVKSLFKSKTIHLEIANDDPERYYKYCTKNQSYAGERYEIGDIDTGIERDDRPIIEQIFF